MRWKNWTIDGNVFFFAAISTIRQFVRSGRSIEIKNSQDSVDDVPLLKSVECNANILSIPSFAAKINKMNKYELFICFPFIS